MENGTKSGASRGRLIYLLPILLGAISIYQGPLSWMINDRGNDVPGEIDIYWSFFIAAAWMASVVLVICVTRQRRALYLLILAPLVLYWQAMWTISYVSIIIQQASR